MSCVRIYNNYYTQSTKITGRNNAKERDGLIVEFSFAKQFVIPN